MSIPRATPDRIAYAQFATRGVLTRLALMFQANADKTFTGTQVVEILVSTTITVGRPGEAPEIESANPDILSLCANAEVQP